MEDFDFVYSFNNKTFYHIAPYLDELGFSTGKNSIKISGRTYDNVLYYKKTITAKHNNKVLCDAIFKTKYNVYFVFYDDLVYIRGLNSIFFYSAFSGWKEVNILESANNEFGSVYSEFKNIYDVKNAIKFIELYIDDEEEAKKYNQNLKQEGNKFFELHYRTGSDTDIKPII